MTTLDPITHRFETLDINSRGQIFLAWLDKRDAVAVKSRGEQYTGIALYAAMSDDEGKSFYVGQCNGHLPPKRHRNVPDWTFQPTSQKEEV